MELAADDGIRLSFDDVAGIDPQDGLYTVVEIADPGGALIHVQIVNRCEFAGGIVHSRLLVEQGILSGTRAGESVEFGVDAQCLPWGDVTCLTAVDSDRNNVITFLCCGDGCPLRRAMNKKLFFFIHRL